jgi:hypothetical protein
LVKDQRGDICADPHKILNRWNNYFCQLLNVYETNSVRQTEMHTVEPFVVEVEAAMEKLKRYSKSSSTDQIQQKSFKQEGKQCILRSTNLLS